MKSISLVATLFLICLSHALAEEVIRPEAKLSFEKDIRPVLQAACFHCHGEGEELGGNLDLRLRRFLMTGGDSGPSISPGTPSESYLLERIQSGEMPPEGSGHPLTDSQQKLISDWIAASAPTLRSEPETLARGLQITPEDRQWWAFLPISQPAIPEIAKSENSSHPVDHFILKQLQEKNFSLSPEADRLTLIRRACFDLWGLPPTPEMIDEFVNDPSPTAWENLVDQLLASPHFGERWGRHWLDTAGYADSEGVTNADPERKWAWQYRDYVIQSLNKNKSIRDFIIEQLAGDELVPLPHKNLNAEASEKLAATGFLRMAADGTMSGEVADKDLAKNEVIADTIEIVSGTLLGLTMECAQCHEHRYDPIPQADYYRMRAVFEPAYNWKSWKTPAQRLVTQYTDEDRKLAAEIEAQAQVILKEREKKQKEFIDLNYNKELEKLTEAERELAVAAREIPEKDRTPEQKEVYKKYPSLSISAGSLYLYDKKAADELKKMADEASEIRKTKPKENFLRVLSEVPNQVPTTFVFHRGDHEQETEAVSPAGLTVLDHLLEAQLPENNPELKTTGRRLAFAEHLTSDQHPLTSRVIVNRIWLHLFGRGIVTTPADFGRLGTPPTHPKLLDWLAHRFLTTNWDYKGMIKYLMMSQTYQQSMSQDPEYLAADPDRSLFGSAPLKRVEAETLRDMVLAVTGKLNKKAFGPPIPVMSDKAGQWVIGIENLSAGRPGPVIDMKGEEFRRSVYVQVRRSRPLAIFETFDLPEMAPNCELRTVSTVAPQSLLLMNGDFFLKQSQYFAERIEQQHQNNPSEQIRQAWRDTYLREPTSDELNNAIHFLENQVTLLKDRLDKPQEIQQAALASLCQILLSSNELLYID